MKYNLSNIPKMVADPTTNEKNIFSHIENMKAELREIKFVLEKERFLTMIDIKEILGE